MKIILDIFGGDNAPAEILNGALDALNTDESLNLILAGKEEVVKSFIISQPKQIQDRIEALYAEDVISNDDVPTTAIKQKKESSLVKSFDVLKQREDVAALVSAGSTGAVLCGAVLKIGRIKGVLRPCLAAILPTLKGTPVCLLDCGATVDSKPEYLRQFADMGNAYMRSMFSLKNPRIALLSNGVEDNKGNELVKETFSLLKENSNINFVGNLEARDALSGDYDVIVSDGFAGNVLLKSVEGTAILVLKSLKKAIYSSKSAKFGALFMKKAFKRLKKDMDYNSFGGAPFLGIEKVVIKSHGSSDRVSICTSILQAKAMAENGLVQSIKDLAPKEEI